jgi:hypothetical protein
MTARFKLAVFAVLLVGTALAQSLRGGSDLRLSSEWQLRPMIHSAFEKLRGYFHGSTPQPAVPTTTTPFTPVDPEARANPSAPNLPPLHAPSFGVGSPLVTQPFTHRETAFHDWLANAAPAPHETALLPGPITLTGSVTHAASAYSAGLDVPAAVASAAPRSRAEVAVAIVSGRTFSAAPASLLQRSFVNTVVSVDTISTFAETSNLFSTTSALFDPTTSILPRHHHHPTTTTIPAPVVIPSANGTPEPTSLGAIAAALLVLTTRRRRK